MEERDDIVTLVDEEGQEQDFEIIMTLEVEGNEYAILLPLEGEDIGEDEAYIFKIVYDGDEESLEAIEDDEEYENVVAVYEAIMEEEMGQENIKH